MKKLTGLLLSWFSFNIAMNAQNYSVIYNILPPGYTATQARQMNDFKVVNDTVFWIGFQQIGLGRYDGSNWTIYNNTNTPMLSNVVNAVALDASGNVWAGTAAGLAKFDGTTWTIYSTFNSGIAGNFILSLAVSGNNLWIGTQTGVSFFDGVTFTNYNTGNSGISNDTVNTIVFRNNEIWFCTNQGLSRWVNNVWTNWHFSDDVISNLVFDFNGDAWLTARTKIFRLNPASSNTDDFVLSLFPDRYQENLDVSVSKYAIYANSTGEVFFLGLPKGMYFHFVIFKYTPSGIQHVYGISDSNYPMNLFNQAGTRILGLSNNRLLLVPRLAVTNKIGVYDFTMAPVALNFNFSLENIRHLDKNNVKARLLTRGDMHWDVANAQYEIPKGSEKHSVFASALWIGGIDENGELRVAAQTYRQQVDMDYYPGPIDGISLPFDSASCQRYDRIWKINSEKVNEFIVNFQNGNVGNGTYKINDDFLTWPANGNNAVTGNLAPFADYNHDGIYNPYDGDYPLIKGDQMHFWIFNDSLGPHTATESEKLGLEVHAKAYAFNRPGNTFLDSVLNHSTFYHYRIINRSIHNYDSVYIGLWCDVDLGKYDDDIAGCDSSLNAGFVLNGDNNDEGMGGYGLNPPMQNVKVLSGPQPYANDGIDNNNDGLIDEPGEECLMTNFMYYENSFDPISGNPTTRFHYYNYMKTLYKNNTPVVGTGGYITRFLYNGQPYSSNFPVPGLFFPGDKRFLIGSGPFRLHAGEESCIEFAYVFSRDITSPNGLTTSTAANIAALQAIETFYNDSLHSSCTAFPLAIPLQPQKSFTFKIFPNPAMDFIAIHGKENWENAAFEIRDLSGRIIQTGNIARSKISIAALKRGLYFLRVPVEGRWITGKFVKQ